MRKLVASLLATMMCMSLLVLPASAVTESVSAYGETLTITNVLEKKTETVTRLDRTFEVTMLYVTEDATVSLKSEYYGEAAIYAMENRPGGEYYYFFANDTAERLSDITKGFVDRYDLDKDNTLFSINAAGVEYYYTVVASPAATEKPAFTDVPATAYYCEPVAWAVENKITSGTTATTFSPNNTCTNAHILTFMWRAAGSPEPMGESPFTNLTGQEYYAKAAAWAYEKGMISGTTFDANKACTRAMTMEYFWKQAGSPETATSDKFTDVPADASHAQAVAWAVANGVTAGTSDSTFSPDNTCTRGQIVTFLYRALV